MTSDVRFPLDGRASVVHTAQVFRDPEACWRIAERRDARFDGQFIVAVRSTRIYCRPSCPATTPKRRNVSFYPTAAAAQSAGYRACKRCRPDASPGSPDWSLRADAVARAMRLIVDGIVDREGVGGLARRVGYSERHLTRLMTEDLGAGPLAVARAQRAQTARTLLESTDLTITTVAFAAGFSSVRQFNDTMREVYATTPTELRTAAHRRSTPPPGRIALRLPFRPPFAAQHLFEFLGARAICGIERFDGTTYTRTLELPQGRGHTVIEPRPDHLAVILQLDDVSDLASAVRRLRDTFDLDADPVTSDAALVRDRTLRDSVRRNPGMRVPGCADPTELAVRAVLGQQISVRGARTLAQRLVAALGTPVTAGDTGLTHCFPSAARIAESDLDMLGMPAARRNAIRSLSAAIAEGRVDLSPGVDRTAARESLLTVAGIGPWTAEYIALRALRDPDAFLASDLGVRHGASRLGIADEAGELERQSQRWRPWRAYAQIHLWHALALPAPQQPAPNPRDHERSAP